MIPRAMPELTKAGLLLVVQGLYERLSVVDETDRVFHKRNTQNHKRKQGRTL